MSTANIRGLVTWVIWLVATSALLPLAWDAGRLAGAKPQEADTQQHRLWYPVNDPWYMYHYLSIAAFGALKRVVGSDAPNHQVSSLCCLLLWPVQLGTRLTPQDLAQHPMAAWFSCGLALEVSLCVAWLCCAAVQQMPWPWIAHVSLLQLAVCQGMMEAGLGWSHWSYAAWGVVYLCGDYALLLVHKFYIPQDEQYTQQALVKLQRCVRAMALLIQARWMLLPCAWLLLSWGWVTPDHCTSAYNTCIVVLTWGPVTCIALVYLHSQVTKIILPVLDWLLALYNRPLMVKLRRQMPS